MFFNLFKFCCHLIQVRACDIDILFIHILFNMRVFRTLNCEVSVTPRNQKHFASCSAVPVMLVIGKCDGHIMWTSDIHKHMLLGLYTSILLDKACLLYIMWSDLFWHSRLITLTTSQPVT